jgi:hypothetical protein
VAAAWARQLLRRVEGPMRTFGNLPDLMASPVRVLRRVRGLD